MEHGFDGLSEFTRTFFIVKNTDVRHFENV